MTSQVVKRLQSRVDPKMPNLPNPINVTKSVARNFFLGGPINFYYCGLYLMVIIDSNALYYIIRSANIDPPLCHLHPVFQLCLKLTVYLMMNLF